mmetsp:Transcript_49186/g.157542  ORF Transcript_49186/g.157542 Transcript_49186/m.157542 type:complete len:244 (+) Transcript_49186:258-989(+)
MMVRIVPNVPRYLGGGAATVMEPPPPTAWAWSWRRTLAVSTGKLKASAQHELKLAARVEATAAVDALVITAALLTRGPPGASGPISAPPEAALLAAASTASTTRGSTSSTGSSPSVTVSRSMLSDAWLGRAASRHAVAVRPERTSLLLGTASATEASTRRAFSELIFAASAVSAHLTPAGAASLAADLGRSVRPMPAGRSPRAGLIAPVATMIVTYGAKEHHRMRDGLEARAGRGGCRALVQC